MMSRRHPCQQTSGQRKVYINIGNPHYSSDAVLFIRPMSKAAHTRSQDRPVSGRGDLSGSLTLRGVVIGIINEDNGH